MAHNHWLIKSEPLTYSFERLVADGRTRWDGVRNFEARNNLRAMKKGDLCLYYHSPRSPDPVAVSVGLQLSESALRKRSPRACPRFRISDDNCIFAVAV